MQTLLVDPSGASSALLMAALQRYGLAVRRVGSLQESLALAQHTSFDLVITAWVLPDGDGIALAQRLRPLINDAAPIIMITASTSPERRRCVSRRHHRRFHARRSGASGQFFALLFILAL